MSHSRPQPQHDSSLSHHEQRELVQSASLGRYKPFAGFTSPYKRLNNEQDKLVKSGEEKRNLSQRQEFLNRYVLLGHGTSSCASPASSICSTAVRSNGRGLVKHENNPKTSWTASKVYTNDPLWNSVNSHKNSRGRQTKNDLRTPTNAQCPSFGSPVARYTNQMEKNARDYRETKRAYDESVFGRVRWGYDMPSQSECQGFSERSMNSQDFREQCRKSYVQANAERQRNAEHSLWSKCNWATFASRPR